MKRKSTAGCEIQNHHIQLMSEVLNLQIFGRWEGFLLAPFPHSFPGVDFHSCWRQNSGLRDIWPSLKWTFLWSNGFLIFMPIITPWSCGVLIGGQAQDPNPLYPPSWIWIETISFTTTTVPVPDQDSNWSLQLNKTAVFQLQKISVDN